MVENDTDNDADRDIDNKHSEPVGNVLLEPSETEVIPDHLRKEDVVRSLSDILERSKSHVAQVAQHQDSERDHVKARNERSLRPVSNDLGLVLEVIIVIDKYQPDNERDKQRELVLLDLSLSRAASYRDQKDISEDKKSVTCVVQAISALHELE